jgi:heme exporter protein D
MLILSLIVRPAISTSAGKVGDNLAIAVCLLVVVTGLIGTRIARRIDPPLAKQAVDRREAREAKIRAANIEAAKARSAKTRD